MTVTVTSRPRVTVTVLLFRVGEGLRSRSPFTCAPELYAMSRKFAEQCTRERAGEAWDNALLYAFKKEVLSTQACAQAAGPKHARRRSRASC